MFKNIKVRDNFRKKFAMATLVLVTSSTVLSGCRVVNDNNEEIENVEKEYYNIDVNINFDNYNLLDENDLVIFFDDEGNIYNGTYSDDNAKELTLYTETLDNIKLGSDTLNTVIDLPSISLDDSYDITIDYATMTYDVKVVEQKMGKTL